MDNPHPEVWRDHGACECARLARDARYDGLFFIAVRTTRVYCRPVCPVSPENVVFYPSAAAAEQAGYRPCLRCRPGAAPGSPAWLGTAGMVARGVRLIEEGFLDEAGVAALADALGIGTRHLSWLFARHAGASPTRVAATARVQRAKHLMDNTDMTLTDIAFAAGYGSIRRFNEVFRCLYGRPPSAVRRWCAVAPGRHAIGARAGSGRYCVGEGHRAAA